MISLSLISGACDNATSPDEVLPLEGTWLLQSFEPNDGSNVTIADPARYTVSFQPNGQLSARVDCNNCTGSYTESGNLLVISPLLACTRAACPPDSLDSEYLAALTSVASYSSTSSDLVLQYDGGAMRFQAE